MKQVELFTFIIPVRNYWKLTKACYRSILNNTPKGFPIGIIFIDNDSIDMNIDYLVNIENENPKTVKVIRKDKSVGFVQSINEGAELAKGEFLIFMYSDILIEDQDWTKKLLKAFDKDIAAVGTSGVLVDRSNQNLRPSKYVTDGVYDYLDTSFYAIRKQTFFNIGKFDKEFSKQFDKNIDLAFKLKLNKCNTKILSELKLRSMNDGKIIRIEDSDLINFEQKEIDKNYIKKILLRKNNGNILLKLTSGELGDKLVGLGLLYELRKQNPNIMIDVFLQSERYNTNEGYAQLFKDLASHIFLRNIEFDEFNYDDIYEISAYGIHDEELISAGKKEIQISRYQRWAKKCELVFKGDVERFYKVEDKDGFRLKHDLKKLKHPIIGISPFTSNTTKDWEKNLPNKENSNWQKLIDKIVLAGGTCIVLDKNNLGYKNCLNLSNLSLRELGYCISNMDLLIGTESGNTHFAGILGIPMLVFVGSSSPMVLRHYKNVIILHKGNCLGCNRFISPTFDKCKCGSALKNPYSECLTSITSEDVFKEISIFKGKEFNKKYLTNFNHV